MATPEDARRANRSLLLRTLHADGPMSRADLAKVAGLTRATVSAVVRDLIDDGVVEELGLSTAGGVGKPATLVDVAADGRHILCVDLSEPSRFVGALVNLAGKVVVRRTYERDGKSGKAAVTLLRRICRELVADAERPLLGVGVASPGVVDDAGVIATAAHLGWSDLPLGATLGRELGLPVVVDQRRQRGGARRAHVRRGRPATSSACASTRASAPGSSSTGGSSPARPTPPARSAMSSSCPTAPCARAASGAAWRPRCRRRC